jgi:hypothetical protein
LTHSGVGLQAFDLFAHGYTIDWPEASLPNGLKTGRAEKMDFRTGFAAHRFSRLSRVRGRRNFAHPAKAGSNAY